MGKNLSLRDFLPIPGGQIAEAAVEYGVEFEEGAPMELDPYRGLARSYEAGSSRLLAAAEAEVPAGGAANLEELIDGLLRLERDAQDLFGPLLRRAEADRASWSEPLVRALEALRDCRWHLMVLQADTDRDDDAPTFAEAGQLRQFLDGLS